MKQTILQIITWFGLSYVLYRLGLQGIALWAFAIILYPVLLGVWAFIDDVLND